MNQTEIRYLQLIILSACVMLVLPSLLRTEGTPFDYETYFHIRAIESIRDGGISQTDGMIFGDRPLKVNALDYLISFLPDPVFLLALIPAICGVISALALYFILRCLDMPIQERTFSTLAFIMSPMFIYTFTVYNDYFFSVVLLLLASLFLLHGKLLPSVILLALVPLFNIHMVIMLVIVLSFLFNRIQNSKSLVPYFIVLLAAVLFLHETGHLNARSVLQSPVLSESITDFGAKPGFGIFNVLLAATGIILSWKDKRAYMFHYYLVVVLLVLSSSFPDAMIFLSIFMSVFGGYAIYRLHIMEWEIKTLKNYTLLLILCGLIFSSGSFIKRLSVDPPTTEEANALKWVNMNTPPDSVILSHYKYGSMIQQIAKRRTVTDKIYYDTATGRRINATREFFISRKIFDMLRVINEYNITHIYVTPEMKDGLVWEREEEGALLVLDTSDRFKRVYRYKGLEIWEVKKDDV